MTNNKLGTSFRTKDTNDLQRRALNQKGKMQLWQSFGIAKMGLRKREGGLRAVCAALSFAYHQCA